MYLNEHTSSSPERDLLSNPYVRWGLMLVGIFIGFLALDIMLRRPLLRELAYVKRELATVEQDMQELIGTTGQAWETSNLLSALNAQKRQVEPARAALADLREFRQSVEMEAQKTSDAVASLNQIIELQQRVSSQRESLSDVEKIWSDVVGLHDRLLAEKEAQQNAVVSLNRVSQLHKQACDTAKDAERAAIEVQKLGDLRTKVLENSAGVEDAQKNAAELIALKDTISKANDVSFVQQAADRLLALRDSLIATDDRTEKSQAHAQELLSLRDELNATAEDTQAATQTWADLKKLERGLRAAGGDIAESVETLELLTDLSEEFRQQTQSLAGLRKSLMDIVMLETTVGRALRVLEPLAQLRNLQRLSDTEVKAAARAILDQRASKLTHGNGSDVADAAKRLPDEDRLFQDKPQSEISERLVPPPQDLIEEGDPIN